MDESKPLWRYFANQYVSARQNFIDAAEATDGRLETLPISQLGPQDEQLSIDICILGPQSPRKLLLHTSGVHGVEGYPGCAVQVKLLERWAAGELEVPDDCAIAVVHAVNPWGMAWMRRVNEDNADLNRNFLPPDEAYVGEPERYHELNTLLNPRTAPGGWDFFALRAGWEILRMGFNTAKQNVAEGQYERPRALQFGGQGLCESPKLLLDWLEGELEGVERCVALDFHTGLGPHGVDSLLIAGEDGDAAFASLRERYGPTVQPLDPDAGVAYRIRGGMLDGFKARWPNIDWTLITQEFGTVKPLKVIAALRAENRLTQWGGKPDGALLRSPERERLLKIFNPPTDRWRGMIMLRGQALIDDTLSDLTSLSAEG